MRAEIIGRDEELAALSTFVSAHEEWPGALVIEGEAGIGKTTLWEETVARADESHVLVCRPSSVETQLSFAGLRDLLEGVVGEVLPELAAPQRRALEVALLLEDASGAPPDPRAISFAFLETLRVLSSERPLLVAVDDVQWLDPPSAAALAFAARRLGRHPIAVLLAQRVEGEQTIPLGLDRALPEDRRRRVQLGPLSLGALHRLLGDRLGIRLSRLVLRKVHDASGGNPFYALEIARVLAAAPELVAGAPLPIPGTLHELMRTRLEGLPRDTEEALLAAASVSVPTVRTIGAALERDVWPSLRPAVSAHVIELAEDQIRFTHPLLASAVYAMADRGRRQELHRALARVARDLEEQARHLALGIDEPDPEAAELLDEAAERARARGAPGAAAELLEHARRLTPAADEEAWALRTLSAAQAFADAGDSERARSLARAVIDRLGRGVTRARAFAALIPWEIDRTPELAELALREGAGDASVRARVHMEEAYVRSIHGDHRAARRSAELLMSVADETGDTTALARALTLLGFVNAFTRWGEAEAPLQRAAELERQGAQLPLYHSPRTYLGLRRLWADELDDARVYLGEQHRRAVEHGDEDTRAALLVHLTQLEVRAGNWRTARRHSREALEIAEQAGLAQTGGIRYASALVDAHEGRTDAARRRGERALSECEAVGDRLFQVQSRLVLGFLELSLGNHGAAVAYFAPLRGMLQQIEVGDPGMHPYRADEVEALIGSGELAQAEERLSELERLGREFNRPRLLATGARCRGQLLAVGGALPAALASVDRALVEHERLPVPFERARTLLVFGQVRRRAKQKRASRESLEQALSTFEELGARLWAAKAHEELARIGGRVRAGELTGTERQVAELVARGLTNREAAAELFVSVRAVEANLSRIYAKLGVRSRTELARRLASRK